VKHVERNFAGRTLRLEAGRLAKQAAGACLLQFGETVVLAAVTVSDNVSTLPFFPLTVEYREKSYAAGKIPGGFLKREGRPSDEEILSARVTDRSVRPLFPEGFKNEVQVFIYVLSADQENDADVLGVTAASAALTMSKVPWNGPIAAVRVGRVEGAWILNPTFQQLEFSDVDMVVSGSADSIVMVEGGALELTEAEMVKGLEVAHKGIRELLDAANELVAEVRQPKMEWTKVEPPAELVARVKALAEARVTEALNLPEKAERAQALAALKATIQEQLAAEFPENTKDVANVIEDIEYRTMREQVLTRGERVDGRDLDTVRPIRCEVGVLPRTHGSALFTRGQTQALVSVTLGTTRDEQRIDSIDVAQETTKSFMLHYNFPPFSTGEVKPIRGTSRREVGHGALAERALQALLPPYDQFPYTLRIVSDILESNGSSSMATICGGSLARGGAHGHPGHRGSSGRHGLQGGGHAPGGQLDPDGHQDRGTRFQHHQPGAREGEAGPAAHPRHHGPGDAEAALAAVQVRTAHHHDADPSRQDRRPDRPQRQDHPRHSGADGRRDQRGRQRHGHHLRRGRRRRAGARHGRRPGAGARSGQGVRGRGEEHHGLRGLHRDPAGCGRPAPHIRAAARAHRAHGGRGKEG
jgi:polyribonucleotide nucleotidyltransferase